MARAPKPTDFILPVDGLGTFTFAKRNFRDEIAIAVEFGRLSEGESETLGDNLRMFCSAMADLKVLTVDGPERWRPAQLDDLDPFDPQDYADMLKVWGALRDKEKTFRRGAGQGGEAGGPGSGGDGGVVVPPTVFPGADGPAVP